MSALRGDFNRSLQQLIQSRHGQPGLGSLRGRYGQDDALPSASQALVVVATPAEFAAVGTTASHPGPDEWTYRRFVLPYASLAAHAGGVGAFMS